MQDSVVVTEGTRTDCKEACALIGGLSAEALLADRGYDTYEIVEMAIKEAMEPVIPFKKNRKIQRDYDKYVYKIRYLVENAFCILSYGGGLRHAMQSGAVLSLPQFRLDAYLCG